MARRCELTGKATQTGHLVSHSNRKTKTVFRPNLVNVTLQSDALGRSVRLRRTDEGWSGTWGEARVTLRRGL